MHQNNNTCASGVANILYIYPKRTLTIYSYCFNNMCFYIIFSHYTNILNYCKNLNQAIFMKIILLAKTYKTHL